MGCKGEVLAHGLNMLLSNLALVGGIKIQSYKDILKMLLKRIRNDEEFVKKVPKIESRKPNYVGMKTYGHGIILYGVNKHGLYDKGM